MDEILFSNSIMVEVSYIRDPLYSSIPNDIVELIIFYRTIQIIHTWTWHIYRNSYCECIAFKINFFNAMDI